MVDREVFDRRLGKLEEALRQLRQVRDRGRGAFLADRELQAATERWLHIACEAALDLAHHLISDRGWRTPATYREAFQILREEDVLGEERARQMAAWAALRNVLVHLYLDVDHNRVFEILVQDLDQLEFYAREIALAARD